MANDQSETPVPSTPDNKVQTSAPAAAVEAGKAVEGAVTASSNPTTYTEPTTAEKAALEQDLFGDEAEHVVEPAKPATGEPGHKFEPESIISSHP
ncbi:hypothetical protein F7Q99_16455 [Streptomyces kaniharaensis]|uniref:Uncharacterized protein n=1 Tax=Streptomyces kaniharaensis TaxID=212423 RepID=A0A6N7KU05_9ACTN|nr:hypothetical protein [Streptomyces kaniharaensis]MQS13818.1 hypothetical protein [Streptomyces kaniharaensis]